MDQSRIGADHTTVAPIDEPIAEVAVTIRDCERVFVEPPLLMKQSARRQQTSRGHARTFPRDSQVRQVPPLVRIHILEGMSGHAVMIAVDNAGMLDSAVPVDQLRTYRTYAG